MRGNFEVFQRSQAVLIKSRPVLSVALNKDEVKLTRFIREQMDPVAWLESEIKVDFPAPEVLRISLQGRQPADLGILVNAVTDVYIDRFANTDYKQLQDKLKRLEQLQKGYEERIQTRKTALVQAQKAVLSGNTPVIDFHQQLTIQRLVEARSDMVKHHREVMSLQVKLAILEAEERGLEAVYGDVFYMCPQPNLPVNLALGAIFRHKGLRDKVLLQVHDTVLDELAKKDPEISRLHKREADLKGRVIAEEKVSPTGVVSERTSSLRRDLRDVREALEARRREIQVSLEDQARSQAGGKARLSIAGLQRDINYYQNLERLTEQEVELYTRETKDLGKSSLDVGELQKDILRWEGMLKLCSDQIDLLEADRGVPPRVTLHESAMITIPDAAQRKLMMTGVAGLGTFGLVLFGFAFWEFRARKVSSTDDVVHDLGINLVGTLPDFSHRPRRWFPGSKSDHYWNSLLTDSVDALRTMMLFTAKMEGMRVVMVTSAVAGEGKTSSCSHLAASLARAGRRTLLVDCDLRKPTVHRLFGVTRTPGMSEVLRGEIEPAATIQPTHVDGLFLLAAGQGDMHAIQALARDRLGQILAGLRAEFDFIVVDSSPVLPVPDSLLLAQHVDAVVFSILRDVSRVPKVYAAVQRLATLGIRILGAVVNGTRDDVYHAAYPYVVEEKV
jgi:capsular exopolysaccharide synthesis family protein